MLQKYSTEKEKNTIITDLLKKGLEADYEGDLGEHIRITDLLLDLGEYQFVSALRDRFQNNTEMRDEKLRTGNYQLATLS